MDTSMFRFRLDPLTSAEIIPGTLSFNNASGNAQVAGNPIPEPTTPLLLGSGLAGLVACRMRKCRA